jgi:hypothetical protein
VHSPCSPCMSSPPSIFDQGMRSNMLGTGKSSLVPFTGERDVGRVSMRVHFFLKPSASASHYTSHSLLKPLNKFHAASYVLPFSSEVGRCEIRVNSAVIFVLELVLRPSRRLDISGNRGTCLLRRLEIEQFGREYIGVNRAELLRTYLVAKCRHVGRLSIFLLQTLDRFPCALGEDRLCR